MAVPYPCFFIQDSLDGSPGSCSWANLMRYKRSDRVADLIKVEVAEIINQKIKDPRIGFLTVTVVDVTQDLREARVYVSVLGEKDREKTLEGLKSASGYIRGELGRRIQLRRVPELTFVLDRSAERAAHLNDLLDQIKGDRDESS